MIITLSLLREKQKQTLEKKIKINCFYSNLKSNHSWLILLYL